ncbi:hypothetical protein [Parageobacillus toebii]|uniref:hypothetical protein n=1 Tax=Parageobacillus toebii TaxID=153151 RepID=UPI001968565B|nr:hypothetical protein [Parageobacillus toebii]QSB49572.1 hypothetical protein JTI59_04665 [Parageobacillus toebii]WMT19689.1 hypothetical protein RFB12_03540 [Parageobacillus toebii]
MRKKSLTPRSFFKYILIMHILFLFSFFPDATAAETLQAYPDQSGFIIQADRIVGKGLVPGIVIDETGNKKFQPMIRFRFASAEIYGLKLIREIQTNNGLFHMIITSKGKVEAGNLVVDATGISFQNLQLRLGELIPAIELKNATLLIHFLTVDHISLQDMAVEYHAGSSNADIPPTVQILNRLFGITSLDDLKRAIDELIKEKAVIVGEENKEDELQSEKDNSSKEPAGQENNQGNNKNDLENGNSSSEEQQKNPQWANEQNGTKQSSVSEQTLEQVQNGSANSSTQHTDHPKDSKQNNSTENVEEKLAPYSAGNEKIYLESEKPSINSGEQIEQVNNAQKKEENIIRKLLGLFNIIP